MAEEKKKLTKESIAKDLGYLVNISMKAAAEAAEIIVHDQRMSALYAAFEQSFDKMRAGEDPAVVEESFLAPLEQYLLSEGTKEFYARFSAGTYEHMLKTVSRLRRKMKSAPNTNPEISNELRPILEQNRRASVMLLLDFAAMDIEENLNLLAEQTDAILNERIPHYNKVYESLFKMYQMTGD